MATELEKKLADALEGAIKLISAEYCSHTGPCSATETACYASEQIAALDAYIEQETKDANPT